MLCFLIIGRWLLPKGVLTRDQLSQLLLEYIAMAPDIMEFSTEGLKEPVVICNLPLIIIILAIWTLSTLQYSLVLRSTAAPKIDIFADKRKTLFCGGCCANEIWSLWITLVMQDVPFLAMRLYLMINYNITDQMMLFFTSKNIMVIALQLYRMCIVCGDNKVEPVDEDTKEPDHGMIVVQAANNNTEQMGVPEVD